MNECLIYPILQKFYNALACLVEISPKKYIFENISKIDTFMQEFRNITFVMQKAFNTDDLKKFYEQKRTEYLSGDNMQWFVDTRNTITKEHPFKLEKQISLKIYDAHDFDEFKTTLTTDRDKSLDDISGEIGGILEQRYKIYSELYYSVFITFQENGKDVDIFDIINPGITSMWNLISDTQKIYPCNCLKCKKLTEQIKEMINRMHFEREMLRVQDCYWHLGKVTFGSCMESYMMKADVFDGKKPIIKLSDSPGFGKEFCDDDLKLLQKHTANYVIVAQLQMEDNPNLSEPEILPCFMIVFDDNTAEMQGMFGSSVKTTHYRKLFEIADRIATENIRAVLYVCEAFTYPLEKLSLKKGCSERQEESDNTIMYNLIASDKFDEVIGIEIDYKGITDNNYLSGQIQNPKPMPKNFMLKPIFEALKNKQKLKTENNK